MEYSERITECLRRDGWRPDRVRDIGAWERAWQAVDCVPPQCVLDFLREFGGLVLRCPTRFFHDWRWFPWPRPVKWRRFADFRFPDAFDSSDWHESSQRCFFRLAGGPVYDVEALGVEGWSLKMGESGRFFCFDDRCDLLYLVAEDTPALLEFIYREVEWNQFPVFTESQLLGEVPDAE